jgi:predicted NUDIX family phosphoesterase
MRAPVEDLLLFTAQQLTETAYDRFIEGVVSQDQLKQFYDVVRIWSRISEEVLETMQEFGIQI